MVAACSIKDAESSLSETDCTGARHGVFCSFYVCNCFGMRLSEGRVSIQKESVSKLLLFIVWYWSVVFILCSASSCVPIATAKCSGV